MKLTITSTDKDVTFTDDTVTVFAKNQVFFDITSESIIFIKNKQRFRNKIEDITVNGALLTAQNAKGLLSAALFREASDAAPGPGGENNWDQEIW
jgi:phage-related tail protein